MARRSRVKLRLIPDESARKAAFNKRKRGFTQKLEEITAICDIKAAAVICSKYDGPEALPSREGVDEVVKKFRELSTREQTKKMKDQPAYMLDRIKKEEDQVKELRDWNQEFKNELFIDCLKGNMKKYNLDEDTMRNLRAYASQYLNGLSRTIENLRLNGESSSMPPPTDNGQSILFPRENGQSSSFPTLTDNGQSSSFPPLMEKGQYSSFSPLNGQSSLLHPHRVNSPPYSFPPRENGQSFSLPPLRENGKSSFDYLPIADNGQSYLVPPRGGNGQSSLLPSFRDKGKSILYPLREYSLSNSVPHLRENGQSPLLPPREMGKSSFLPLPESGQSSPFPYLGDNGQSSSFAHLTENGHSSSFPPAVGVAEAVSHGVANVAPLVDADMGAVAASFGGNFDHIQYQNTNMNLEHNMNPNQYEPVQYQAPVGSYDQIQHGINDKNQNMSMNHTQYQPVQYQAPADLYDQVQHGIHDTNQNLSMTMNHNQYQPPQYQAPVGSYDQIQQGIHDMNLNQNMNMSMQHNQYEPVQYQDPVGFYDQIQHGGQNMSPNQYPNHQQSFTGPLMGHPQQQMGYVGENAITPFMDGHNYHYNQPPTAPLATTSTGHMSSINTATTTDAFAPNINNYRY